LVIALVRRGAAQGLWNVTVEIGTVEWILDDGLLIE
jgi:hypothetical protein